MFRYERPQKGRERMFTQFDVEALGSLDPRLDAEVIALTVQFFEALGFRLERGSEQSLMVVLSSLGDGADRQRFREALHAFLRPRLLELCELCQSRFERNVLRILDCKNPRCRELLGDPEADRPDMLELLSDANREHLESVEALLDDLAIPHQRSSDLVRGLDYYTRTVFEVHYPPLGARSALCGGGRYDHLVEELGGPDLGAVGCAIGFTPTLIAMEELGLFGQLDEHAPEVFVVAAGEEPGLLRAVFELAAELRKAGISAVYDHDGKKVKAQMRAAVRAGVSHCVILGTDELARGCVGLKELATGEQHEVERSDLVARLRQAGGGGPA
jgi:histidyl-tRNA synthetase